MRQYRQRQNIMNLNDANLRNLFASLWALEGKGRYHLDSIMANPARLKEELVNLLVDEGKPAKQQYDRFKKNISGAGRNVISELLHFTHPRDYILWNDPAEDALTYFNIQVPSENEFNGEEYVAYGKIVREIHKVIWPRIIDFINKNNEKHPHLDKVAQDLTTTDCFLRYIGSKHNPNP